MLRFGMGIRMKRIINYEKAVEGFLAAVNRAGVCLHGFVLTCDGKKIAERYYEPFRADTLHRMYSVTKSFTSLAIGLLAEEGRLKLDDRIVDYFKDKLSGNEADERLYDMTIRDMLCMKTCYASTTYKADTSKEWVGSFFNTKPDHYPGTVFNYDTSSSHTLAALVERLTGMKLLDYLRSRALDRIGFSKEAYILPDPQGSPQGGSGLMCTLRDMHAVACLCCDNGRFGDEQLLPEWYIEEASQCHASTAMSSSINEQQGYGYMFWRTRYGGYCMYGMGGELALIFPEHKLVFSTIGNTLSSSTGLPLLYEAFYNHIFSLFEPYVCDTELKRKTLSGVSTPTLEAEISGAVYRCEKNEAGLKWFCFDFDAGVLRFEDGRGINRLDFGIGEWAFGRFPGTDYECMTCAAWTTRNTFQVNTEIIGEALSYFMFEAGFSGENATVHLQALNSEEKFLAGYKGFAAAKLCR